MARLASRERLSFSKLREVKDLPNLIEVQTDSFRWFLEEGVAVSDDQRVTVVEGQAQARSARQPGPKARGQVHELVIGAITGFRAIKLAKLFTQGRKPAQKGGKPGCTGFPGWGGGVDSWSGALTRTYGSTVSGYAQHLERCGKAASAHQRISTPTTDRMIDKFASDAYGETHPNKEG